MSNDPDRDLGINANAEPLESVTNGFVYDDQAVTLHLEDRTYKIGLSRLTQRSPVFRDMLKIPQPPTSSSDSIVVRLHNDPEEFEHYLWAIHADVLDVYEFASEPGSKKKCVKLLGIASVAHQYQSARLANRCLGDALNILEGPVDYLDTALSVQLYSTIRRWVDEPSIGTRVRKLIVNALNANRIDAFSLILFVEPLKEEELLGFAYYTLLRDPKHGWLSDSRTRRIDRDRLLTGAFTLSRKWHELYGNYTRLGWSSTDSTPAWVIFHKLRTLQRTGDHRPSLAYNSQATVGMHTAFQDANEIERNLFQFFDPSSL